MKRVLQRLCEYCPYPSKPAVCSIVITTRHAHRQKAHRAFVCAEHRDWFRNEEQKKRHC